MSRPSLVTRQMPSIFLRPLHTSRRTLNEIITPPSIPIPASVPRASDGIPSRHNAPLARLPAKTLIRSLVLSSVMKRRWLLQPALVALGFICKSNLAIFNADRNPILNRILRLAIYDQHAAGTTAAEVSQTINEMKSTGYHGVILGHAKEVVLQDPSDRLSESEFDYGQTQERAVEQWKKAQLHTLGMVNEGDFLAIKLTGAGNMVSDALRAGQPMPACISQAMDEICHSVHEKGSRIWIDAEQQAFQPTLDDWTIELMRRHNRGNQALVFNTIQAYLKGARSNANRHVKLAAEEGWTVGVKLVRGAYIENEVRSLIHDTKFDTDQSYDDIADMFISQILPEGCRKGVKFPHSTLFLATHNAPSVTKAAGTYQERRAAGLPTLSTLECGQVHGMADELSCSLLQKYEDSMRDPSLVKYPLRVYKCLSWGSVAECLGYLYRRAVENRGAVERTEHMQRALFIELRRRLFG